MSEEMREDIVRGIFPFSRVGECQPFFMAERSQLNVLLRCCRMVGRRDYDELLGRNLPAVKVLRPVFVVAQSNGGIARADELAYFFTQSCLQSERNVRVRFAKRLQASGQQMIRESSDDSQTYFSRFSFR